MGEKQMGFNRWVEKQFIYLYFFFFFHVIKNDFLQFFSVALVIVCMSDIAWFHTKLLIQKEDVINVRDRCMH